MDKFLQNITRRLTRVEKVLNLNINNLTQDDTHMEVQKDLVARGHIVASLCEPNKVVTTNEHKQLRTLELNELIQGEGHISVQKRGAGLVIKNTQQSTQVDQMMINLPPTNNKHIATKEYVDNQVPKPIKSELNMTSRIDILNPDGNCLRIGRTLNNMIDVNVDTNGTLNLINERPDGKENEIDIFGERINLLSSLNSSGPNSGSLVLYGGMGIIKDLHIGDGLFLKTYEGIPTKLDYYEYDAIPVVWTGIWENDIESQIVYQRLGANVTIMIPYTGGRVNTKEGTKIIENTVETYLPERLRPVFDIDEETKVFDDGAKKTGYIKIYGDDGRIVIGIEGENYGNIGISGFKTVSSISYMVNTKPKTEIKII